MTSYYSLRSISYTLSNNSVNRITDEDIYFYEMNLHCLTNALYYGTGEVCQAPLAVGDCVFFKNGNLRDFFVQNQTPDSNGKVIVVATVPTEDTVKVLRL